MTGGETFRTQNSCETCCKANHRMRKEEIYIRDLAANSGLPTECIKKWLLDIRYPTFNGWTVVSHSKRNTTPGKTIFMLDLGFSQLSLNSTIFRDAVQPVPTFRPRKLPRLQYMAS
jgi:hypothetical protein